MQGKRTGQLPPGYSIYHALGHHAIQLGEYMRSRPDGMTSRGDFEKFCLEGLGMVRSTMMTFVKSAQAEHVTPTGVKLFQKTIDGTEWLWLEDYPLVMKPFTIEVSLEGPRDLGIAERELIKAAIKDYGIPPSMKDAVSITGIKVTSIGTDHSNAA